jgi:hypothetical protein
MSVNEQTTYRGSQGSSAWPFEEPRDARQPMPTGSRLVANVSSDNVLPLFLSEPHEPDQQEFPCLAESRWPSIFWRFCGLAVSAIAIVAAAYNSDAQSTLINRANISIGGAAGDQSAPHASANASPPRPQAEASAGVIISADHPGLLGEVPAAKPHTGNEVAAPPKPLASETVALLMTRVKNLLSLGDIAAARLLLERLADAHDAAAAFLLAQTYDPAVLGVTDSRSVTPDPAMARDWYRKAASFGSVNAQRRLAQIRD